MTKEPEAPEHRYRIRPANAGAHLYEVTLEVQRPDRSGQVFRLPAWIPGSYMIRDYAKHVVSIRAESEGREVRLEKVDKSSWLAEPVEAPLTLVLDIFAYDASVRGAHLDTTHAYFNGTCVFPEVAGQEHHPCELVVEAPPEGIGTDWRVVTAMRARDARKYGYGSYEADDYAELIDHPFEIGQLQIGEFEAGGIPHTIAIRGTSRVDMARICRDLSALCAEQLAFLGRPKNLDQYVFLLMLQEDAYGGLEHRCSSSLLCSRSDLPVRGETTVKESYRKFLGLCSHEYFHLWNVKRMRPEGFTPYDLQKETYTGQLWVFEGITSYYDDLMLLRAGLITQESYLDLLAKTVTRVIRAHGRFRQTVEESSFDAWIKFYKQDANSPNAIVSYYTKGALIALALDLTLRHLTDGRCSLDDVMKECWRRYGETGVAMPERGFESVAASVSGTELGDFFERYVRGTSDLPLRQLLEEVGVVYGLRQAEDAKDSGGTAPRSERVTKAWFGASLANRAGKNLVANVQAASPAERAGLAPGDELVALDNLKLTVANADALMRDYREGDVVTISVFRGDELMRFSVTLKTPPEDTCYLTMAENPSQAVLARRKAWLTGKPVTGAA
ncbi:MAG: PDZ domain-containing protein [Woeseiaceae bacterium]|nr:PDZ domain-containing protein [Woeseiaceae bacterium]